MKRILSPTPKRSFLPQASLLWLLLLSAGCCHCRNLAGNSQVQPSKVLNPMMQDVARWLRQRELIYTTNEIDGVIAFRAYFADQPGAEPSCAWAVATNPEADLLTIHAAFSPAISPGMETMAFVWLTSVNSVSPWGFYGFDAQESQLWFRISLFRASQHVEPDEMDRLLAETTAAMRQADKLLTAEGAREIKSDDLGHRNDRTHDHDDSPVASPDSVSTPAIDG
jgi:hypothetical protein